MRTESQAQQTERQTLISLTILVCCTGRHPEAVRFLDRKDGHVG
jgi:hypothetical protein